MGSTPKDSKSQAEEDLKRIKQQIHSVEREKSHLIEKMSKTVGAVKGTSQQHGAKEHALLVTALLSSTEELRQELTTKIDVVRSIADDAMRMVEFHAKTVELLSSEVSQLKALLQEKVESKAIQASRDPISRFACLQGHQKLITGITIPSGSHNLYTGSKDGTVRVWDCDSGQAWNPMNLSGVCLSGPVGQVHAITTTDGLLFAGTQDGRILVWKFGPGISFERAAALTGHKHAVMSLVVGRSNTLYSASMDCTIKVWATAESGNLEVVCTHREEHGILSLFGMHDAQANPVLICSMNDTGICLYDLPSFNIRGRFVSKEDVRVMRRGPGGLFFSGDGTGDLTVWKWSVLQREDQKTNKRKSRECEDRSISTFP
ncbi:Zinc finger CCCH domain-containing protein 17 [Acorus gramineus]|uniref:Zinc finger CCCH domain-containing protein 17 n=1 Tax=Acorus gramineus TaxID=55184 RepID=A0AAV9ACS8_ACOGR|nr:Zinc finger CCCH domain-containing protein 17 [Acorus gramineus]